LLIKPAGLITHALRKIGRHGGGIELKNNARRLQIVRRSAADCEARGFVKRATRAKSRALNMPLDSKSRPDSKKGIEVVGGRAMVNGPGSRKLLLYAHGGLPPVIPEGFGFSGAR
jgi:hypothetical protein